MTQAKFRDGTPMQMAYAPLRTLQDVEELERVPLDERIFSWNLNDWIARGCMLDPDKIAIRYIADGDPDGEQISIRYRELRSRAIQAANLFHALGVSSDDVVMYVLPTVPQLYVVMMGAVGAGIACGVNWMLKPELLAELVRATNPKAVVTLGPTPGYEIWENVQAIRREISPAVHILTVPGPGGAVILETDFDTLAARHPGDRLLFEHAIEPDHIAAYVHSGGTTGSPKLVKLTHRGFAYKCWANALVMAHTSDDVIFADYPMFHIAGIFGRGYFPIAHGNRSSSHLRSAHATSASSTITGNSWTSSGSRSFPACRRRSHSSPRTVRAARSSARCAITPAPARPPSRPRWRGRSKA